MHPYFSTPVQPWQFFNPIDIGMTQRPSAWFDPSAYPAFYNQSPYNHAPYRDPFPGFETTPYYASNPYNAGFVPRLVFHPVPVSHEMGHGMSPIGFPGFGISEYLSPENFVSGLGKTAGNYLPPEFLEFLRAPALEHESTDVKEQAHLAATAQFFYSLGLLYTRGIIIPPEVPGSSSRAEEQSSSTTCEVFGEALERFAREQFQRRGIGRDLGELSEKARLCFRALAPESEQLERVRDESIRLNRKKAVNA